MKRPYLQAGAPIVAPTIGGGKAACLCAAVLMLGLTACDADPAGNDSTNVSQSNAALAADARTTRPPAKAEATPAALVLAGDGLQIAGPDGAASHLTFDVPKAEALQALSKALGGAPSDSGANEECGGGSQDYAEWKGEIVAWFAEDRFVGWESKGKLKTADGLGIGSRRSSMPQFQVEKSSLGVEFSGSTGLYGLLESTTPEARVTALWAGSTCIFR